MSDKPRMTVRILFKPEGNITWKEFIRYDTKEEAISYLENVNPTLRPALITSGESTLRAYDVGIIDYQDIAKMEHEFNTLQQESKQAIEILPQLKEICKLYIRTKQEEIAQISVEMTGKSYQECQTAIAKMEIIQSEIEKLQSILKESIL